MTITTNCLLCRQYASSYIQSIGMFISTEYRISAFCPKALWYFRSLPAGFDSNGSGKPSVLEPLSHRHSLHCSNLMGRKVRWSTLVDSYVFIVMQPLKNKFFCHILIQGWYQGHIKQPFNWHINPLLLILWGNILGHLLLRMNFWFLIGIVQNQINPKPQITKGIIQELHKEKNQHLWFVFFHFKNFKATNSRINEFNIVLFKICYQASRRQNKNYILSKKATKYLETWFSQQ